jgi:hypothetical protein
VSVQRSVGKSSSRGSFGATAAETFAGGGNPQRTATTTEEKNMNTIAYDHSR